MKLLKLGLLLMFAAALCAPVLAQKPGSVFEGDQEPKYASSRRLDDLSDQLARAAENLADEVYRDYINRGNRTDLEAVFLAQQFNASADLFYKLVRDRRSTQELRQATTILQDLHRRGSASAQRNRWFNVQRNLDDINRELNFGGGTGGDGRNGRVTWRGTVDDRVQLIIRDDYIETRTLGGQEYNDANYNFTNYLPRRRVSLSLNKRRGRGDVRIVQQPAQFNDWTAIVEIRDNRGGADGYEFELIWQ